MTPEQRDALVGASVEVLDALAAYDGATDLRDAAAAGPLDDDLAIRLAVHVLEGAAHELARLSGYLAVAAKIGSDYGAAFKSVQAEQASDALRQKGDRNRTRARLLRSQGWTIKRIAVHLDVTPRRVQQLLKD